MKIGSKIILENPNKNHANTILPITPVYPGFCIETRYINIILKEVATVYARLISQYMFRNHTLFSASFHKINGEHRRTDETELFNILNFDRSLTESDLDNVDVKSQLEHQI